MRIIYTLAVVLVVSVLMSCSESIETQLEGKWILKSYEIISFDSVCKAKSADCNYKLNKMLEQIDFEIMSDNGRKTELTNMKAKLEADRAKYTEANIRDAYIEESNKLIGKMTITFSSSKKRISINTPYEDIQSGTWTVSNDTITTIFDNQHAEKMIVKEVSQRKLQIFSKSIDDGYPDLNLNFTKE